MRATDQASTVTYQFSEVLLLGHRLSKSEARHVRSMNNLAARADILEIAGGIASLK